MIKKIILLVLIINCSQSFCQINFEEEKVLIDKFQMPYSNSEALTADLNGDGTKDLITTDISGGYITAYQNIGGQFTEIPCGLILDNQNEYPTGISVIDIDNDGLLDIIACNRFSNKINWFRNLGDFNFSGLTPLISIANGPKYTLVADIDADGIDDLVVALASNITVVWLKNNGNGVFSNPVPIYNTNTFGVEKIVAKDLNIDGNLDIALGNVDGEINWIRNLGNGVFAPSVPLTYANSGRAFDFEDINNDNYPDFVYAADNKVYKKLNLSGSTFGNSQMMNTTFSFNEIKFKDINNDGLMDLVGSTDNDISYMKRTNGNFANAIVLFNASPVTHFIAEDVNNDIFTDFIVPTYSMSNDSNVQRLSAFMNNAGSYTEKLISFFNSGVFCGKIADLDNDGKNDIISCFRSVVWNKNKGGDAFTSYKKISTTFPYSDTFNFDIEPVDIDNDNDIDIVASTTLGIEIYYNDGNGNFTLGSTTAIQLGGRSIEIVDFNGDGYKDIAICINYGSISLAWLPNLTGTTFGSLTTIDNLSNGNKRYLMKCGDMDNDGDIDIVTYSSFYARLNLYKNDGNGIFTTSLVQNEIGATSLAIADFDNDGDQDIFIGGNYNLGIYLIKNNNGIFASQSLIQSINVNVIEFADLDGDGLKELVALANQTSGVVILYYLKNTGNNFDSQVIVNSNTNSVLPDNIAIGNLNNDSKLDIVKSFSFSSKVTYCINTSTLSISNTEKKDDFSFYPVPFDHVLKWTPSVTDTDPYNISIYNEDGKLVYSNKKVYTSSIDLSFLSKGIYVVDLKSGSNSYSRKVIKN